ncbi:MAG: hypothetical protein ACE5FU_14095, partial [Nitrospinota bacterium]
MKNREKRAAGFLVFCFVLPLVHGCFSYNMELRSFATAFSPDMYTDFTFHTRPVSPFQFGMVFSPSVPADLKTFEKGAGRKLPGNPEEWLMDSLTEKEKNEILGKMITTVTIKPASSPLVLSDNLDLEVVVPGLKEILMKFNVGNFKTGLYVTVSADTLLHRKLNWLEV